MTFWDSESLFCRELGFQAALMQEIVCPESGNIFGPVSRTCRRFEADVYLIFKQHKSIGEKV